MQNFTPKVKVDPQLRNNGHGMDALVGAGLLWPLS